MARLFVYGTLRDVDRQRGWLGREPQSRPARLEGYRQTPHPFGPWPAARPDPSASIEGLLLEELSEKDLTRLDEYEGVREGLYRRVLAVATAGGERLEAFVYVKP